MKSRSFDTIVKNMQHNMKLAAEPFAKIATSEKVIESRLFDEKRQRISIGDEIVFCANEDPDKTVTEK